MGRKGVRMMRCDRDSRAPLCGPRDEQRFRGGAACEFCLCHRRIRRGHVSWHEHTVDMKALRRRSAVVGRTMNETAKNDRERTNHHFSLPAKGNKKGRS